MPATPEHKLPDDKRRQIKEQTKQDQSKLSDGIKNN